MTPSAFHVPPRPVMAGARVCGAPPPRSSRFSAPPAKKPMERLSGDQKGDARALGARQRLRRRRRQRPQPQAGRAVTRGHEDDLPAVGRERKRRGLVGGGRDDLGARLGRRGWRRLAQMPHRGNGERGDRQHARRRARPSRPAVRATAMTVAAPSSAARPSRTRPRAPGARRRCRAARCFGSFCRQRAAAGERRGRRSAGKRVPRRARSSATAASVSETSSPAKRRVPVSISNSTHAERPDVRALVDRLAARLLRAHVGRRAEDHPAPVVIAGDVIVGRLRHARRRIAPRWVPALSRGRSPAPSPCRRGAP